MQPQPITSPASAAQNLTNEEAALWLNLSPRTLEKMRTLGGGPKFRKFGRRVLYTTADLQTWSDSRAFESTSDPHYPALRREHPAGTRRAVS